MRQTYIFKTLPLHRQYHGIGVQCLLGSILLAYSIYTSTEHEHEHEHEREHEHELNGARVEYFNTFLHPHRRTPKRAIYFPALHLQSLAKRLGVTVPILLGRRKA